MAGLVANQPVSSYLLRASHQMPSKTISSQSACLQGNPQTGPGCVQLVPSYHGFSFFSKPPQYFLNPVFLNLVHGSALVSSLNLSELSQVLAPSQFLITVPLRGLTGYRESQIRHWRYYTVNGAKLLSSVRDPEELHQWLEVEQFSKSLQQWHEEDVNIEGDLVPAKVLIVFRELVEKSIISCNLSSEFGGDRCKGNHHTHKVFGLHGQELSKTL